MSQIGGVQNTQGVSIAKISERSPQVALAMLMMEMAELNKTNAQSKIGDIEAAQAKKKECSEMLNLAREYKTKGLHTNDAGIPSGIDDKFIQYCKDNNITVPHYAKTADSKEKLDAKWDTAIAQLQTKLDSIGGNTQTQMVQLQDLMGQYNSQIQGANSAIAQANQIMTSLAKGG